MLQKVPNQLRELRAKWDIVVNSVWPSRSFPTVLSQATLPANLGAKIINSLPSSKWYLCSRKSSRMIDTHFYAKNDKLWQWIRAKRSFSLRQRSRIHTCGKKFFPVIYNMRMFEVVCKNLHFSRKFMNLQLKLYLFLRVGPTRNQNHDLRQLPDFF